MYPFITLKIPVYSLAVLIGFLVSLILVTLRRMEYGYNERLLLVVGACILAGMAAGSKLLYFTTKLPYVFSEFTVHRMIHTFITSGFVFYGGLFGAIGACLLCSKILLIDSRKLLNFFTPVFAAFHGIGRIG